MGIDTTGGRGAAREGAVGKYVLSGAETVGGLGVEACDVPGDGVCVCACECAGECGWEFDACDDWDGDGGCELDCEYDWVEDSCNEDCGRGRAMLPIFDRCIVLRVLAPRAAAGRSGSG